jgi:hypothetical protein
VDTFWQSAPALLLPCPPALTMALPVTLTSLPPYLSLLPQSSEYELHPLAIAWPLLPCLAWSLHLIPKRCSLWKAFNPKGIWQDQRTGFLPAERSEIMCKPDRLRLRLALLGSPRCWGTILFRRPFSRGRNFVPYCMFPHHQFFPCCLEQGHRPGHPSGTHSFLAPRHKGETLPSPGSEVPSSSRLPFPSTAPSHP